jgi:hypothetical protein
MSKTVLTEQSDITWLFETALAAYADKVARPVVAILYGNEDSPETVELYAVNDKTTLPYAVFDLSTTGTLLETSDLVQFGIARAYFADAWARREEQDPEGMNFSGVEIFDVVPDEIAPEALNAAATLAKALLECNGVGSLGELYRRAEDIEPSRYADRALAPELFGHYLGMEAMGHGVGLDSFGFRFESIDGGIVRTGETLKQVGSETVLAVPYLEGIVL